MKLTENKKKPKPTEKTWKREPKSDEQQKREPLRERREPPKDKPTKEK
jgi:hypothetical protein